ncbi:MAG: ParB/RepB/Spo0J family partition protein [Desulforhopalus sp.]|nr:ParB/RepB/Spo0J family partition protein [Desulforhopalus sp.]
MVKKTGLGLGVGILFGEDKEKYFECDISKLIPNKHQPRSNFNQQDLEELAESIREKGVIQPLIVTSGSNNGTYELVAGERRLRASKLAGLTRVPVVVIDGIDENGLLELALIENIQRTDLNPIEEADAYKKLIDKFGYTQEETAKKVGKQRSTITNLLRLLKLPETVQKDISLGLLSEGHGRALIRLAEEPNKLKEVKDLIVKKGLSVREAEKIIKKSVANNKTPARNTAVSSENEMSQAYLNALVTQLTNVLSSKVVLQQNGTRGKIEIEYYSQDDLVRVFNLLLGEK